MTVVFTTESDDLIVVTADSAVTLDFGESRAYEIGRKTYFYPGVGCVATWGARDHNQVGPFLEAHSVAEGSHDINALAYLVEEYLRVEYRPDELGVGEVGYHVAGFDTSGQPKLWRIAYASSQALAENSSDEGFERSEHAPPAGGANFHYNGRNDLADTLVNTVLDELQRAGDANFNLSLRLDLVRLSDFVVRFASEVTPEVGPPFITHLMNRENQGVLMANRELSPIPSGKIAERLERIGFARS